jgi:hypothetical protein
MWPWPFSAAVPAPPLSSSELGQIARARRSYYGASAAEEGRAPDPSAPAAPDEPPAAAEPATSDPGQSPARAEPAATPDGDESPPELPPPVPDAVATGPPPTPPLNATPRQEPFSIRRQLARLRLDFARETDAHGRTEVVIRVARLGWLVVAIHLCLAFKGLFDLVTSIYSYFADAQNNAALQQIQTSIDQMKAKLEQTTVRLQEKLRNSMEGERDCSKAEVARRAEEQVRESLLGAYVGA